jgi:hypothetical protein
MEDPDLSLPGSSKDSYRPSIPEGVQGEAVGGGEVRENFLQRISTAWATDVASVRKVVQRLVAEKLTADETSEFLAEARAHLDNPARDPHGPFSGLERAAFPIGAACTAHRVAAWRKRRAKLKPPRTFVVECSGDGCGAKFDVPSETKAKGVTCGRCGTRTRLVSENEMCGELVKRVGGGE